MSKTSTHKCLLTSYVQSEINSSYANDFLIEQLSHFLYDKRIDQMMHHLLIREISNIFEVKNLLFSCFEMTSMNNLRHSRFYREVIETSFFGELVFSSENKKQTTRNRFEKNHDPNILVAVCCLIQDMRRLQTNV